MLGSSLLKQIYALYRTDDQNFFNNLNETAGCQGAYKETECNAAELGVLFTRINAKSLLTFDGEDDLIKAVSFEKLEYFAVGIDDF